MIGASKITISCGDSHKIIINPNWAIITDPVYENSWNNIVQPVSLNQTAIYFCKPENQYFVPDEYAFWIKTPSTKNFSRSLGRFVEMILIRRGITFNKLHWSQMIGVYTDMVVESQHHAWAKPVSLLERLIRIYTNIGDTVFDPYMGSGSVGIACYHLGRHFVGCEINENTFAQAQQRLLEEGCFGP
jgi:hypothetical protein